MKLVNIEVIKDELERLIRNYRFYSSTEAKYRYEAYTELSEWLDGLEVKETGTVWHSFSEVIPPQGSDICVYWDRDKIITTGIWEESEKPKYASKWAYTDDLLQEPTNPFDSHIQEGDKITVNEDGSRFNRSQLERVVELSRYSKPYEAKRVKRTSADIEAAMKEIDELSKAFTEAHPEGGDQMLTEIRGEYHIVDNNEMVSEELEEAARRAAVDKPDTPLEFLMERPYDSVKEQKFIEGAMWQKRHDNIPQELVENYCEFIKEGGKNVCALINAVNACNAKKAECISKDLEDEATKYAQDKYMPVQTAVVQSKVGNH